MTRSLILAGLIAAGLGLTAVSAAAAQGKNRGPDFTQLEADGSGEVTQEELQSFAPNPARASARFVAADSDHSGGRSLEEMQEARKAFGERMEGRRGAFGGPAGNGDL